MQGCGDRSRRGAESPPERRMRFERILRDVDRYYSERITAHGATARGVDWNSAESQRLRFDQLLTVCRPAPSPVSITDYGCGYGALVTHLTERGWSFRYRGVDLSNTMLARARAEHAGDTRCEFASDDGALVQSDYTVASGIFNVKLDVDDREWQAYMETTVDRLAALSTRGFAFNALTIYSDPERRRGDLHYADPLFWFDYCKRHHSRYVSLLHDYPLYEFTLVVTRETEID